MTKLLVVIAELTQIIVSPVNNHPVAAPSGYGNSTGSPLQGFVYDPTGQIAPPGAKPRVTATLWEDEGSLCYQVEAKGVCVARREGTFIALNPLLIEQFPV
jgi:protein SOK2